MRWLQLALIAELDTRTERADVRDSVVAAGAISSGSSSLLRRWRPIRLASVHLRIFDAVESHTQRTESPCFAAA